MAVSQRTSGGGGVDCSINWTNTEQQHPCLTHQGNPVFFKEVDIGAMPNNTTKNVPHGISNLALIVAHDGKVFNTTNNATLPLPYVSGSTSYVVITFDLTNIIIQTGTNLTAYNQGRMRLMYTKSA